MILVRHRSNTTRPEIVFEGSEKQCIAKIHELDLCDYHDVYFYKRNCIENLGLSGDNYDYYSMYDSEKIMNRILQLNEVEEDECTKLARAKGYKGYDGDASNNKLNAIRKWLETSFSIYIEIGLDQTSYPKFSFEVYHYIDWGQWTRLDPIDSVEFFLYRTDEEALSEAIKVALQCIEIEDELLIKIYPYGHKH